MNDPLDPQNSNIHEIGYDAEDYTPFGDEYETLGHEYGRDHTEGVPQDDSVGMGEDTTTRRSSRFALRYSIEKRAGMDAGPFGPAATAFAIGLGGLMPMQGCSEPGCKRRDSGWDVVRGKTKLYKGSDGQLRCRSHHYQNEQ